MLTEKEIKEMEELKKDPDVKLARRAKNKEKQYLYLLRGLKRKGQMLREMSQNRNKS